MKEHLLCARTNDRFPQVYCTGDREV
jgi:hypothetical protein